MCVPGCREVVMGHLSRRGFFTAMGSAAAAAVTLPALSVPSHAAGDVTFNRVIDLTHPLTPDFPTFFGEPGLRLEELFNFAEHSFHSNRWILDEHTGTHMDAPLHFAEGGAGPADLPVEQLVVPLAVLDLRAEADENPDYQASPDDIAKWEAVHGPLPEGCCVAMHSDWARHVNDAKFRNVDSDGVMHFPGFHAEATDMLMTERNAVGIAVDTLSLDHGPSQDFAVHFSWLPSGRWGLEGVAGLDDVPASGATLVVGAPKIVAATDGPSRLFALV